MKPSLWSLVSFVSCALVAMNAAHAGTRHVWVVPSPTHEQTYAYGSEAHQAWVAEGKDRHLALSAEFTNEPHVDRVEPKQYDDFTFAFPDITLGKDGRTFYYHPPGGRSVPVAVRRPDFLGVNEIKLLDNSILVMKSPHGYLSLELIVRDRPFPKTSEASL